MPTPEQFQELISNQSPDEERPNRFQDENWTDRFKGATAEATPVNKEELSRFRKKLDPSYQQALDSYLSEADAVFSAEMQATNIAHVKAAQVQAKTGENYSGIGRGSSGVKNLTLDPEIRYLISGKDGGRAMSVRELPNEKLDQEPLDIETPSDLHGMRLRAFEFWRLGFRAADITEILNAEKADVTYSDIRDWLRAFDRKYKPKKETPDVNEG